VVEIGQVSEKIRHMQLGSAGIKSQENMGKKSNPEIIGQPETISYRTCHIQDKEKEAEGGETAGY
jgi:hypothetical protein